MTLINKLLTAGIFLVVLQGCSNNSGSIFSKDNIPFVHRIDVQQGNVITQEMLAKLKVGMDKKKVRFIMGTPLINDTFHSERWDYLFTYKNGRDQREQRRVTLFFKNQLLSRVDGDVNAARGEIALEKKKMESVDVPPAPPKGLFSRVKEKVTFNSDKPKVDKKATEETIKTVKNEAEEATEESLDINSDADEDEDPQDFEPTTSQKSLFDTMWEGGEPR